MKILITGGSGFIGSYLAEQLMSLGHKICVYDAFLSFIDKPLYYKAALEHRELLHRNIPHLIIDENIEDSTSLKTAFDKFRPEIVVHLAGLPMARPLPNYQSSMIPINMDGTLRVLEAFENSPSARRFIYTSSSMSYGHFTQSPQPEDVMLNPINTYGATKAAGEYFVKLSKKEWVIVRPTSVYGYTDAANRVTQLLFDAAIQKKSAWVVRGETLDFSDVRDVADGFTKCILSPSAMYQTFNISRGEPRLSSDFAEALKKYFPKFEYEIKEPTSQQVFRGALDISRAQKLLGFEPKYSMEDGIANMIKLAKKYDWKATAYKDML